MTKEIKRFDSLDQMNDFLKEGVTVYSLANAGSIWFLEYSTTKKDSGSRIERSLYEEINYMEKEGIIKNGAFNKYFVSNEAKFCAIMSTRTLEENELVKENLEYLSYHVLDSIIEQKKKK